MERDIKADLIRERLAENMRALYDATLDVYKKYKAKPEFGEFPEGGKIESITFISIPEKIKQAIFVLVEELKPSLQCDYVKRYKIAKCKVDDEYEFEIRSK